MAIQRSMLYIQNSITTANMFTIRSFAFNYYEYEQQIDFEQFFSAILFCFIISYLV